MRDLHNTIRVLCAIPPKAVGTTGVAGGSLSNVIDRQGFDALEFAYTYGTTASAVDTMNVIVYESESSTTGFTSVANDHLLGLEADAGYGAGAKASGTTQNVAKRIGYAGLKRYVRTRVYSTGSATGLISADAILAWPNSAPTA